MEYWVVREFSLSHIRRWSTHLLFLYIIRHILLILWHLEQAAVFVVHWAGLRSNSWQVIIVEYFLAYSMWMTTHCKHITGILPGFPVIDDIWLSLL